MDFTFIYYLLEKNPLDQTPRIKVCRINYLLNLSEHLS